MADNAAHEQGASSTRLFTQEEVNKIVAERLARERKNAASEADLTARENDLKAREKALSKRLEAETTAKKVDAFKSLLKDAGVLEKHFDSIVADSKKADAIINALELDADGAVVNRAAQLERVKTDFAGSIARKITVQGDDFFNPPAWMGSQSESRDTALKRAFGLKD